ncbi:unnamed protein product, partial [Gulo gulo]
MSRAGNSAACRTPTVSCGENERGPESRDCSNTRPGPRPSTHQPFSSAGQLGRREQAGAREEDRSLSPSQELGMTSVEAGAERLTDLPKVGRQVHSRAHPS